MKIHQWRLVVVICLVFGYAAEARADGWMKIQQVGPVGMPGMVIFLADGVTTACTQNSAIPNSNWLYYSSSNGENVKAVYAGLLLALISKQSVYVSYNGMTCAVSGVNFGL